MDNATKVTYFVIKCCAVLHMSPSCLIFISHIVLIHVQLCACVPVCLVCLYLLAGDDRCKWKQYSQSDVRTVRTGQQEATRERQFMIIIVHSVDNTCLSTLYKHAVRSWRLWLHR